MMVCLCHSGLSLFLSQYLPFLDYHRGSSSSSPTPRNEPSAIVGRSKEVPNQGSDGYLRYAAHTTPALRYMPERIIQTSAILNYSLNPSCAAVVVVTCALSALGLPYSPAPHPPLAMLHALYVIIQQLHFRR